MSGPYTEDPRLEPRRLVPPYRALGAPERGGAETARDCPPAQRRSSSDVAMADEAPVADQVEDGAATDTPG
jgi:hypothetical protein